MVTFTKIELPYSYDALEPSIDKETMQIHYEKHHQAYCDKVNAAIDGVDCEDNIEDMCKNISKYSMPVRNNLGGVFNHNFFWKSMCENGSEISLDFKSKIEDTFGSIDEFKKQFSQAAIGQFGSGWAWLCKNENGELFITSTPNQDNPLMDCVEKSGTPLIGLDVWEHAYYLKYQNKRPEYIEHFFNVVNWEEVERRYNE